MTAADRVFDLVRSDIVTGKIARNEMLSIYQLAEIYRVSRTPVREAVLRLASLGLVVVEKNHGVRVRGLTSSDVREIFQTRILIEVPSAFNAAQTNPPGVRDLFVATMERLQEAAANNDLTAFVQADYELHAIVIGWTGNQKAAKIVNQLRDETHSLGASTFQEGRSMIEVLHEHTPIYEAILNGDAQLAAVQMKTHLAKTAQIVLKKLAAPKSDLEEVEATNPIIFIDL